MSLRGIHIIFIIASILLSIFFAMWALNQNQHTLSAGYIFAAIVSFIAAFVLMIYGINFVQKIK